MLLQVRFVVLDEADQMLDMGFQEDMEVILQQVRMRLGCGGMWGLGSCGGVSGHVASGFHEWKFVGGSRADHVMFWSRRLQQLRMQVPNMALHACARVLLVPVVFCLWSVSLTLDVVLFAVLLVPRLCTADAH
jgi:hypothetical protein